MNKFIFITHTTPVSKRSPLRQKLYELHIAALMKQSYSEWKVIQLGERPDVKDDKFHHFVLPDGSREEKPGLINTIFNDKRFIELLQWSDYLIKLDDDDIISPVILRQLEKYSGDLYYDRWHTFTDCSSGIITQQDRKWIASTCVHKTSHALSTWIGESASPVGNLLYSDHSKAWHQYYKGRNTEQADPLHPVYLRVLSPTSVTSGLRKGDGNFSSEEKQKYYAYLSGFGNWKQAKTIDFDEYRSRINEAWKIFSGAEQQSLPELITKVPFRTKLRSLFGRQ